MAIDMAKRRRIIKKSKGAMSIHRYRAETRKAEGKPPKAAILKPTKHVPKVRTEAELAKLSPAQRLYVEKGLKTPGGFPIEGVAASSQEGAKRMLRTFKEGDKPAAAAAAPLTPEGATPEEIAAQQSLVKEPTLLERGKKALGFGKPDVAEERIGTTFLGTPVMAPVGETVEERMQQQAINAAIAGSALSIPSVSTRIIIKLSGYSPALGASAIGKSVNKMLLQKSMPTIIKDLTAKSVSKSIKWIVGGVAGMDALMVWYSLDNVIGGQKFFLRDVASGVEEGTINPAEAKRALDESMESKEWAVSLVEWSAKLNPLAWPFRNLLLSGIKTDEMAIQVHADRIEKVYSEFKKGGIIETEEDRLWEEKWD